MATGLFLSKRALISILLITIAMWILMHSNVNAADSEAAIMPPPPEVEVMTITPTMQRNWSHFSGKLAAVDIVEIKPLVGGRIEQVFLMMGIWSKKMPRYF